MKEEQILFHLKKIQLRLQDPSGDSISCITPLKKIERNRNQVLEIGQV